MKSKYNCTIATIISSSSFDGLRIENEQWIWRKNVLMKPT